jgi:hypothetical protein
MVAMEPAERIRASAVATLAPSSRWAITVERGPAGFAIRAEHPASAGMIIETGTFDEGAAIAMVKQWMRDSEFSVADAAPDLVHGDIALGVRTLTAAFNWPTDQVRAVAFLLFEAGGLTSDEAGWLAGYASHDAPMHARPPI